LSDVCKPNVPGYALAIHDGNAVELTIALVYLRFPIHRMLHTLIRG